MTASGLVALGQPASAAGNFQITLEACQQDGTITLPNSDGKFICPEVAKGKDFYTTGNLGKNWNELDLVPHRLTLSDSEAEDVTLSYGGDYKLHQTGDPGVGWDVVSDLVLNTALTTAAGCDAHPAGGIQHEAVGATGGAYSTVEKTATLHMPDTGTKGECVYDFYMRLALGASAYPGASLQSYISAGGGKKTLSLPVQEALPQKLTKSMLATRDATQLWNVTKLPSPATVTFPDTCVTGDVTKAGVDITVTWTKTEVTPNGQTVLVSNIYATNPAARPVNVTVTDKMYEGTTQTTQVGSTWTSAPTTVAANTTTLVGTNTQYVTSSATHFNDVATGAYVDTVTGVAIPQSTTGVADAAVTQGSVADSAVTISDVESMTGAGFTFSVDSTTGASGSFGSYVTGTKTTGPVTWTSGEQTGDDSVTFHKTVYAARGTIGSASLTDTATASNGSQVVATSNTVTIPVSADTKVALTIDKTIAPAADRELTFTFDVFAGDKEVVSNVPITLAAGQLSNSTTVTGLAPGTYTVHEDGQGPFAPQDSDPVVLSGVSDATCAGSVGIHNAFDPPVVRVQKVTQPAGSEAGWTFTLTGPGLPAAGVPVTTTGSGGILFPAVLGTGTYTVTESGQTDWDLTGVTGSVPPVADATTCTLTVDQLADAGRTFDCAFTNTKRGKITVVKKTVPASDAQSFPFTLSQAGTVLNSFDLLDGKSVTTSSLKAGTYAAAETLPDGWDTTSATCDDESDPAAIDLAPGENVTCTFVNTKRGRIIVDKVTDPSGDTKTFDFALTGPNVSQSFSLADQSTPRDSGYLLEGTYSVVESTVDGWTATGASCDNGDPVTAIALHAGDVVRCTFNNSKLGRILIDKVTEPAGDTQSFPFSLQGGPAGNTISQSFGLTDTAAPHDSGFVRAGTYNASETMPAGWAPKSAVCSDGSPVTAIAVSAGEIVTCTFTNTKQATVKVIKKENGNTPTKEYTFHLTGPGGVDVSIATSSTNLGVLDFGYVAPGTGYKMCEEKVGAGVHSTLQDAPYNGTLNPTTGDVCVTFDLTAGQDKVFTVNNTFPLGDARTIGYWKNWNTCAKASEAKAKKTGNKLMDWYLPIVLANDPTPSNTSDYNGYVVTNCTKGVAVLAAASAKNAENQLAAQLLAAKLNVAAGAKHSSTTDTKIVHAVDLLTQMKYKGPPSSIIGSNDPRRADVLATATYLDNYNNSKIV